MPRRKPTPPPPVHPHDFINNHPPVGDMERAAKLVDQMNEELRVYERDSLHDTHWDPVTGKFHVKQSGYTGYLTHLACRRCGRIQRTKEFPSRGSLFVAYLDNCYDCHQAVTGKDLRPRERRSNMKRIIPQIAPPPEPKPYVDEILPGILERLGPGLRRSLAAEYRRKHEP